MESSGFKFYGHNRIDRPGDDLGILCRDTYKCTLEKQDSLISFDYSIWKIEVESCISFYVVGIYKATYSPMHLVTSAIFLDEFPDFVGDVVDSYMKILSVVTPTYTVIWMTIMRSNVWITSWTILI